MKSVPQGRLRVAQDAVLGLLDFVEPGKDIQDCVLGHFQPSLRDWTCFTYPTQHCVLGYSQPFLRD